MGLSCLPYQKKTRCASIRLVKVITFCFSNWLHNRVLYSVLFLLAISAVSCQSTDLTVKQNTTEVQLIDHKISLVLPAGWSLQFSEKRYFQLTANSGKGSYSPSIEYRGLSTDLKDRSLMDQYASGWYNAMGRNFPNFQYSIRQERIENQVTTYYFEGTFKDGNMLLKKIGSLRFKNKKIHAIYYTAPANEFDDYQDLFDALNKQIRYLD